MLPFGYFPKDSSWGYLNRSFVAVGFTSTVKGGWRCSGGWWGYLAKCSGTSLGALVIPLAASLTLTDDYTPQVPSSLSPPFSLCLQIHPPPPLSLPFSLLISIASPLLLCLLSLSPCSLYHLLSLPPPPPHPSLSPSLPPSKPPGAKEQINMK